MGVIIILTGKTVVVGVCGGIAAYKVVDVVSRLKKLNADVNVVMTENATKFVTPLTFQSISHNPVFIDMFSEPKKWNIEHIALAQKADIFVIAPATASFIGKIANGIADCLLSTTVMATKATVLFVPAMNYNMYENPIVQANIEKLKSFGYMFLEPDTGVMAEGTSGKGRLPEPPVIIENIKNVLVQKQDLKGVKVLVTAGPTREAIDPVRYITNHSSGKMGYAVAEAALKRGADVLVVSGPVSIQKPAGLEVIDVTTAQEMYEKVLERYSDFEVMIMVAAVADYRSSAVSNIKIKKSNSNLTLELEKNIDIAKELGKIKGNRILVGACAETNDLIENALIKIETKNFDLIMANDVTLEGAGFGVDTNIVKIISKNGEIVELPKMEKIKVAHKLLDEIVKLIDN
jgi:phosphopantothenoylcysteine decarboxylase / phosphopantothenate---cysteine ligase